MKTNLPPAQAHEAARQELLRRLPAEEVRADETRRGLYATDASIYQFMPVAIVTPRDRDDIAEVLKVAREFGVPVMPRGGGTSLAGQATNTAIVLDVSKHMNKILELNAEEKWVRVEPGLIRDELNAKIAKHGLEYAPETSTSNRAAIGGMIGNNSSGMRSIRYGRTIDHLLGMTAMLADGSIVEMEPRTPEERRRLMEEDSPEGKLWRAVDLVMSENRGHVEERFPKVMRRVGGYSLDEFPEEDKPWNLAKLVCGSEGTLALILDAKLKLIEPPAHIGILAIHYDDITRALESVPGILEHDPLSVELVDSEVVQLAKLNPGTARLAGWIEGAPEAILSTELTGESEEELKQKLDRLENELREKGIGYAWPRMIEPAARTEVVELRKQGLGILLGMKGDLKPIPFIEDACVPPKHLAEYLTKVRGLVADRGIRTVMFGHASVGVVHIRPVMNLKDPEQVAKMRGISHETMELCRSFGGSWSGEHGDGIARGAHNEDFWGPELIGAFRQIKRAFDPQNLMNPGRVFDTPPMNENLRYGPAYKASPGATYFRFEAEQGFDRAIEMCNGVGACRKTMTGTMCPSYMATRDEDATTRGRANALRLAISGQVPGGLSGHGVHEVLDLCLECKACKTECPSSVDMAKMKSEHLQHYMDQNGGSLRSKLFGDFPRAGRMLSGPLAPLANAVQRSGLFRLFSRWIGIAPEREVPPFARHKFQTLYREHRRNSAGAASGGEEKGEQAERRAVCLFADCFTNYQETGLGMSALRLLESMGYDVVLVAGACCQRTRISKGFLRQARREGGRSVAQLAKVAREGLPILVLEPSCASAFTDDLPDLVEPHLKESAELVAKSVAPMEEWLWNEVREGRAALPANGGGRPTAKYLVHGHCHQKSLFSTTPAKKLFGRLSLDGNGARPEVSEVDSGCCGMAGSFGYEAEHYEVSQTIGRQRLFPAVEATQEEETTLVANGTSCRHQIADATGRRAMHTIEALARATLGEG